MKKDKYSPGTKLLFTDPQSGESFRGVVVENYKFDTDICVNWDNGINSAYKKDWLDKFTVVLTD